VIISAYPIVGIAAGYEPGGIGMYVPLPVRGEGFRTMVHTPEGNVASNRVLGSPERLTALAELLSRYDRVAALDEAEEPQGWSLAFTFSELEGSFRRFLD
jgi:hypothetical protein